jgi:hypothetical protein
MMNIDCTLNALKVPGFSGFDPPFGAKKPNGQPVTGEEANNNAMLPFKVMRPLPVTENSTTTQIQTNVVFEFTTGNITLTLSAAAYSGCRVSVLNSSSTNATVAFGQNSIVVLAKDSVHLEFLNNTWVVVDDPADVLASIALSLDSAGLANRETQKTIKQRIQTGVVTIKNRGVIKGCVVAKSTTAIRNLNLAAGAVFMNGQEMSCPAFDNAALVPSNNSGESLTCYAYLYLDANGKIKFACTAPGENVSDNGMALYRLTVPAVNTETSDPNLANVTLSDVRRLEAGYPVQFNSLAYASVALPFNMLDAEYQVTTELLDLKGGSNQRPTVYPGDKAANGFRIYTDGTLDMVKVRWTAIKTNL